MLADQVEERGGALICYYLLFLHFLLLLSTLTYPGATCGTTEFLQVSLIF